MLVLFVCIYNLPRFFEHEISCYSVAPSSPAVNDTANLNTTDTPLPSANGNDCRGELVKNRAYQIVYENILYCLVVYLGPFSLLAYFNVRLIRELLQSHRKRRGSLRGGAAASPTTTDEQHERNNITLVMVVIVVMFLVTQTPAYVNQLLYYLLAETRYLCGDTYFYYFHLSNLVVSSNSSLNFVVYCICRRNFRRRLVALCRRD